MYNHKTTLRVRYGETDQMGYMYHGNYAQYLEVGRVEMLRHLNISYKNLEDQNIIMPVTEIKIKYLKPARYDDLIDINTQIRSMPSVRVSFDYQLFNQYGELITNAATSLVFVDKILNKPCLPPVSFINALKPFFES